VRYGGAPAVSADGPRNRERILPDERLLLDAAMVKKLQSYEENPIRTNERILVDVDFELGHTFGVASKRERWVFASVAAERAAAKAAGFDLFSQANDLSDLRHFVLRPRGKKAAVDELQDAIRQLSADYNTHVGALVSDEFIKPLLCVIHVRYDDTLEMFDIHAHCMWRVSSDNMDAVFQGVQTKFSTVWAEEEPIRNPAALANYLLTWVLDHRGLQDWPRDAVLALWRLKRPRFIRPAGAFACFLKDHDDCRFVREDGAVQVVPVQKRPTPATKVSVEGLQTGSVVGYVQAKIMGQLRWCAIALVKKGERLTRRHIDDILANSTRAAGRAPASYTTTTTGLSPFPAGPTSSVAPTSGTTPNPVDPMSSAATATTGPSPIPANPTPSAAVPTDPVSEISAEPSTQRQSEGPADPRSPGSPYIRRRKRFLIFLSFQLNRLTNVVVRIVRGSRLRMKRQQGP
jgi:hypothetical protein